MAGGKNNIRPEDGKQFSKDYQPAEKWTEKKSLELGQELIDWLKQKDSEGEDKGNIFFEEFLIIEKDLYDDLIRYLSNKFSSFSELIKKAKKIQEIKLQKYGVGDRLNATMTKFVLTNIHNWSEKTENKNEISLTEFSLKDVLKFKE
jgi:hypothetical protein